MKEAYPLPLTRGEEAGKKQLRLVRAAARIAVIAQYGNEHKCLFVQHQTKGLELPGGAMETGEVPPQTALRELAEEAGIRLPTHHPLQLIVMIPIKDHRGGDWLDIVYTTVVTSTQLSAQSVAELPSLWLKREEIELQVDHQLSSYNGALIALGAHVIG